MNIKYKINHDNNWCIIVKSVIDSNDNINSNQKEVLKLLCDMLHENNKQKIISEAKII